MGKEQVSRSAEVAQAGAKPKCSCGKQPFYPAKVRAMVNGFERIITFQNGYTCEIDWNGPDRGQSHGRHGMNLLFLLKGERGAIQFVVFTGWETTWKEYDEGLSVMPADIGAHAYKPMYEGQTSMGECEWLDGKECFYDGSGLQANEVFKVFVRRGEEAMWSELEKYYKHWLCKEPWPVGKANTL